MVAAGLLVVERLSALLAGLGLGRVALVELLLEVVLLALAVLQPARSLLGRGSGPVPAPAPRYTTGYGDPLRNVIPDLLGGGGGCSVGIGGSIYRFYTVSQGRLEAQHV